MADLPALLPKGLAFQKKHHVLGEAVTLSVDVSAASAALATALARDEPFPTDALLHAAVGVEGAQEVSLGRPGRSVRFRAQAGTSASLDLYPDAAAVVGALQRGSLAEALAPGLDLPEIAGHRYLALRWGYAFSGSADGAMALGAVGLSFGAEAARDAGYGILRLVPPTAGARSAIAATVESFMLPSQVRSATDLEPGTWIVAEVDGGLSAKLGVSYGLDFNWARRIEGPAGLGGDVGLKLRAGIQASLGFTLAGQYALALSRPSLDPARQRVRVQLFKLRKKGWSFALAGRASVQADFSDLLDRDKDEFLRAVFGVHGLQILKDVDGFLTSGDTLEAALARLGIDNAKGFLRDVTGIDVEAALAQARKQVLGLINAWRELPHKLAGAIYDLVERKIERLPELRAFLTRIKATSLDELRTELTALLEQVDFARTPAGQWLVAAATGGLLSALEDEYARLQQLATKTLAILDGDALERTLRRLQTQIDERLGLDQIEKAVQAATPDALDSWLRARLAGLLGKVPAVAELNALATHLRELRQRVVEYAGGAREALEREYGLELSLLHERTDEKQALLDAEFDFGAAGADAGLLSALLRDTVDGRFDTLLTRPPSGVTVRAARLSHETRRRTHVALHLPFGSTFVEHQTMSKATFERREDGLYVYDLAAADEVLKRDMRSRLALTARYLPGTDLRVFEAPEASYSYTLRLARRRMKVSELQALTGAVVDRYFPARFAPRHYGEWVRDLDDAVDRRLRALGAGQLGSDQIGDTLLALELALPAAAVEAWLKPADDATRERVEVALRTRLRELTPLAYFGDVAHEDGAVSATTLLVYSALEPATRMGRFDSRVDPPASEPSVSWDPQDDKHVAALVNHPPSVARLGRLAGDFEQRLKARGKSMPNVTTIRRQALGQVGIVLLRSLLIGEQEIVAGALHALETLSGLDPAHPMQAVDQLEAFGAAVVNAFNKEIGGSYGTDWTRPLGSLLFLEAARALSPAAAAAAPLARLELNVVSDDSAFVPWLAGATAPADKVLLTTTLLHWR